MLFPDYPAIAGHCHELAIDARRKGQYDLANYWAEGAYQADRENLPWWDICGGPLPAFDEPIYITIEL